MLDPTGRVAMITGANRGIGAAVASRLRAEGWQVSLGARDAAAAGPGLGDNGVLRHRYDARDRATDGEWLAATLERFGRVDALVNNAGIIHLEDLESLGDEALDDMWNVNVKAPLRMIQATLPRLRESGEGRIVNLISMSGKRVKGTFAPGYAMSKYAALALSHAVRHTGYEDGIRVTAVCPGFVATDMTDAFGPDRAVMVQPDDLAEMISTVMALPNTASVAELLVTCEPEAIA